MKLIIYIYVIHHATNQLCIKQNINLELSRFSIRSVFAGKLSDGIWLKKFLDNMSQDAKDVVPGGLKSAETGRCRSAKDLRSGISLLKLAYEAAPS